MRRLVLSALFALLALPAFAREPAFTTRIHPDHGPYLVGPKNLPVYGMITEGRGGDDLSPINSCKQRCRTDWPLVTVSDGEPSVGPNLPQELMSVLHLEGENIAYYNSWALFYFAGDSDPGAPNGHGIHTYGGWWALVRPDGSLIRTGVMPGAND